jgi:hypothetical protein
MKLAFLIVVIAAVFIINNHLLGDNAPSIWLTSTDIHDVWDTKVFSAQSTVDGKTYVAEVRGRDFDKVPIWDEKHSFPLSLDQIRSASIDAFKKRFTAFNDYSISSIQIIHVKIIDRWLCEIEFDRVDQEGIILSKIYLLILPNGKIITP